MNKEDIKVGQIYVWRKSPEKKFRIEHISERGKITWYSFYSNREVIKEYYVSNLLNAINGRYAYLVENVDQKPTYRMDRFRFV